MSTVVLKANSSIVREIIQHYQQRAVPAKSPYVQALFKVTGTTITVYTSGKVLFQGESAEQEAAKWGYKPEQSDSPSGQDIPIIGTDEVGNGSYFGGLAVVASFVTPSDHAFLRSLGVDDSKKMTDAHIRKIAPLLKERIPMRALLLSPRKYNEVIEQGYNAVSVKVALHNQAIYLLLQDGVQPDKIVIDAFTSKKNYDKYVKQERHHFANPITLEEKAESRYLAVAVSSIIARDLFLQNLIDLGTQLGLTLPSGAGQASDRIAAQILQTHGLAGLAQTAKLHFANTQKAQALANKG